MEGRPANEYLTYTIDMNVFICTYNRINIQDNNIYLNIHVYIVCIQHIICYSEYSVFLM